MSQLVLTDFENLEQTFANIIQTESWKQLQEDFNKAQLVFFVGNGGNMSVASHSASDVTRLTNKLALAADSQSILTSIANDFGYENIFQRWIELHSHIITTNTLVIGLSGSGNSKNILSALHWAHNQYNFMCTLISGQKSQALQTTINEVIFDVKYFHTAEILSLMAMYELVHGTGNKCPSIKDEIVRKWGTNA